MTEFYAKKELDLLYYSMKKTPYNKKNHWQKFLSNDIAIASRNQKEIWEWEICFDEIESHSN